VKKEPEKKPCPECGGEVSDNAGTCPHCGAPVKPEQPKAVAERQAPVPPRETKEAPASAVEANRYMLRREGSASEEGPFRLEVLAAAYKEGKLGSGAKVQQAGGRGWLPVETLMSRHGVALAAPARASNPASTGSTSRWLVLIDEASGREDGPLTTEQVNEMILAGKIRLGTLMKPEGAPSWLKADAVPAFQSLVMKMDLPTTGDSFESSAFQSSSGSSGPAVIVAMLVAGLLIGLLVSQYTPIFGGGFLGSMGRPWSPARQSLIGTHVLAFGILGGALGWFISRKMKQ